MKSVSLALIFSLSYSQLIWAADARQMLLDAKASFEEIDPRRAGGMPVGALAQAQGAQESAVEQQAALQDLQNMNFSLTTQNGDILKYVGDKLSEVEGADGTTLKNIQLNADGTIQDADLKLADGSIQLYQDGQVIAYQTPDGGQIFYEQGLATKYISKDGTETLYSYLKDVSQAVIQTTLESSKAKAIYDAQGKLKESLSKTTGVATYFVAGVIQKIVNSDGSEVLFVQQTLANGDIQVTPQGQAQELTTLVNQTKWTGTANLSYNTNPVLKFKANFSEGDLPDQGIVVTAAYSTTRKITLSLTPGTGSTFKYNTAAATPLNINFKKNTAYNVELKWDSTRVGVYIWEEGASRPAAPQAFISVRNWSPKFTVTATNASIDKDPLSSGKYTKAVTSEDKLSGFQDKAYYERIDFKFDSQSTTNKVVLTAVQKNGVVTRTMTFTYASGKWTLRPSNYNASTRATAAGTAVTVKQVLDPLKEYVAELRIEGGRAKLYVYQKGTPRPSAPIGSITAYDVATRFSSSLVNATARGSILKGDPSAPTVDFQSVTYDKDGNLKEILKKGGGKLLFDKGVLKEALDPNGAKTSFSFEESALQNLTGSAITQNGLVSTYDADGKLSEVRLSDMTIRYQNDAIESITKADGTELYGLTFDAAGKVKNATIVTPEGEERTYVDGHLVKLRRPDETVLDYSFNDVTKVVGLLKMTTPDRLEYNFSYLPGVIEATLASPVAEADALTPVKMQYDGNFNLRKVIRQNQEILSYAADATLESVQGQSESPKIFNYIKDAAGKVISYMVTQDSVVTTYDANNQPLKAVIGATSVNPHALEVTYSYAKIREIKKDGVLTFKYGYTFDTENREVTTIDDLEEKTTKKYQNGLLLTSTDNATSVLSAYSYNQGKIESVRVTRLGRELHSYAYSYQNDSTLVTDEEGVVRTYGSDRKLLYLEREGSKFQYLYFKNQDGAEIVEEDLIRQTLSNGWVAFYTDKNLDRIEITEGSPLTNIQWDSESAVLVAFKEGARFEFKDGSLTRTKDAAGLEFNYSYILGEAGQISQTWITRGDSVIKYDASGRLLGVSLSGLPTKAETSSKTTHTYTNDAGSGFGGYLSADMDMSTAFYESHRHHSGGMGTVIAEHAFNEPQTLEEVQFKMAVYGYAGGNYIKGYEAYYYVEVLRNGAWQMIPGSFGGHYPQNGGGETNIDSGIVTLSNLGLTDIDAVRAFAHGYGNSSDNAQANGQAWIYEFQYELSDFSWLAFDGATKTLQGDGGKILFEGSAANVQAAVGIPAAAREKFLSAGQIFSAKPSLKDGIPYLSGSVFAPDWFSSVKEAIGNEIVVAQEYSVGGALESQTKADQTTTLFENNKPAVVLNKAGETLIEYAYDAQGNPTRVYLKNARQTLPEETQKAQSRIAEERQKQLLALAQSKNLSYQSIKDQADYARQQLAAQAAGLAGQLSGLEGQKVHGSSAKKAKSQALDQIRGAIGQVQAQMDQLNTSEANAYAQLDGQVKALSDQIAVDAQKAVAELFIQETNLKQEILRQEISPIVYDAYRRILGRDPSSAEYQYWVGQTDYSSGDAFVETRVTGDPGDPGSMPFAEAGGQVFVEAENYASIANAGGNSWAVQSEDGAFSGGTSVKAVGGSYFNATGIEQNSARLDYKVSFATPGTYYLWVRGFAPDGASDTLHAGLDGVVSAGADRIGRFSFAATSWSGRDMENLRLTVVVSAAGEHTLNFWIREAGFRLDKFILTQDTGFIPTGFGPAESARSSQAKTLSRALTDYLSALPELAERQAYVQHVKDKVKAKINNYLTLSQAQKEAFASQLGVSSSDLIALSASDAQKILAWIDSRSLHFGQSAFLSLESLLDQKGISYAREDIAEKAILIDILSGVISPLDDGDLVLSVFSLNKVASLYGLVLSGAQISFAELLSVYQQNASSRVIAHVNGNHFVVITAVSSETVTYIDPGAGKDKQNEVVTLSKKDFLKGWKGAVTLENAKIQTASLQAKTLSSEETKKIRGAFFFFFIPAIIGAISGIGAAIGSVLAGVGAILSGVGAALAGALSSIGGFLATLAQTIGSIGSAIFQGISFAASSLFSAIGNVGSFLSQTVFGSLVKAGFGNVLFESAVKIGLNFAVNLGLDAVGVSPEISRYVSAFASGGIVGGLGNIGSFVQQGFMNILPTLGQDLGVQLNLDPNLRAAISIFANGFTDGLATIDVGNGITSVVTENLAKAGAFYGISELGDSLGLDSAISAAFALPILGGIGRSFDVGRIVGEDIIQSIVDGITGSFVQAGIDFAIDQMEIDDPLLSALSSAVLTRTVSSLLDPNGNVVEDLLEKAGDFGEKFLGEITSTDFIRHATQYGVESALEAYASSVFSRQALEEIHGIGGIAQIISGRSQLIDYNGTTLTKVNITSSEGFVLGENGEFVGSFRTINGVQEEVFGQFDINSAKSKLINGTVRQVHPNGEVSYIEVRNGKAYRLVLKMPEQGSAPSQATVKYVPCAGSETGCIEFDLKEGQLAEPVWSWEVVENYDGKLNVDGFDVVDGLFLINGEVSFNISNYYGRSMTVDAPEDTGTGIPVDTYSLTYPGQIDYLLLNGVRGETVPEGVPPAYFDPNLEYSFVDSLGNEPGVTKTRIDYVALFEDKNFPILDVPAIDTMVDILWDVARSRYWQQKEVRDAINKLNVIHNSQTTSFVPLAYSGGGQTLVKALNDGGAAYDQVKNIVLVGAPMVMNQKITNPNVQRVINVQGESDMFRSLFSKDLGVETVNIVLKGIDHFEYFYTPKLNDILLGLQNEYNELLGRTDLDSTARRFNLNLQIIEQKAKIEKVLYADAFIARLTAVSIDESRWNLLRQELPPPVNGVITIDAATLFGSQLETLKASKGIMS